MFIILTGPRQTESPLAKRGSCERQFQRSRLNQAGEEQRESGQVPLLGIRVKYTRKDVRGFYWCISILLGHGQGRVGSRNLWQGPVL